MIKLLATGNIVTKYGKFKEYLFYDGISESIALVKGDIEDAENVLCRIHSHCVPAHIFNSTECDCREQMEVAQQRIHSAGQGIIVWLDQEGKGNGHMAALLSANLKEEGIPQTEAYKKLGYEKDARSFTKAAEIIQFFNISSIKIMTNNPSKSQSMSSLGITVSGIDEIFIQPNNPELFQTYMDKINNQNHSIKINNE